VIYAYDQQERLALIESAIAKLRIPQGSALDFGCGTGDFSRLLMAMGLSVCGYDPYVQPLIRAKAFRYLESISELRLVGRSQDLALTVTTLDHILDERELLDTLTVIRSCLKPSAFLLMLEYALDCTEDRTKYGMERNGYQSFRLLPEWLELLRRSHFRVESVSPMPHPIASPSSGYTAYSRSLLVCTMRRFRRLFVKSVWIDPALRWCGGRFVRRCLKASGFHAGSPLKLIRSRALPNEVA
jgi:hypothetical protein